MEWLRRNWHRALAHALGLAPLIFWAAGYLYDGLSANLVRYLMLRTGLVSIVFLLACLACTPASLLGWRRAVQVRRPLGLYAFFYAALHLLIYGAFDSGLDLELIGRDLIERPSMLVGLLGLLALVPLALTSTGGWQRRLGRRWRTLHLLIYLAAPLAVLHYYWLDRDIKDAPLRAAAALALLLALRLPPLRQALVRARRR